jgi:glycine cleavage system H protein
MSANKCRVVPSDEQRCIWMTAGILSYQLCDHGFDCDDCPLDSAMRKHVMRQVPAGDIPAGHDDLPSFHQGLRVDRRYSGNHCWLKEIDKNRLQVGLEPGLAETFLSLKTIVFPAAGQEVRSGQTCLWVVLQGGTFPIASPVDGTVRAINHQLASKPHLLLLQPFDQGWLYELESENPLNPTDLMDERTAASSYAEDETCFKASLAKALRRNQVSVGVTMADGGQQLQNSADMLGPSKYFSILLKTYA